MTVADPLLPGLAVSRETVDRLLALQSMLTKWNPAINLVSKASLPDAWTRHILDSVQIYALAPRAGDRWVDLGSGGGFPGLVVAILAQEQDPERTVTLVEADQRKATFLRQAAHTLGTPITVLDQRIEELDPLNADVLSARALAPLTKLCAFAVRHMRADGIALFQKGANYRAEIDAAMAEWTFNLTVHPSETDSSAVTLALKAIVHV
jgi:16S rRNA (guanine527-N7)-methyltransferase